ncbi:MAG: beta-glucosidase [Bifidobacteriaceae bacterium]|nr:beta-glucosidase [Bifidobacteriaceae bacterium]
MAPTHRTRTLALILVGLVAAGLGGYAGWTSLKPGPAAEVSGATAAASENSTPPVAVTSTATATATPTPSDKQTLPSPAPDQAQAAFDAMSQAERLGLLVMPAVDCGGTGAAEAFIRDQHIGSVVLLGDCWTGDTAKAAADRLVAAGGSSLIVAADQEGGQVQRVKGGGVDTIPAGTDQGTMSPADLQQAAQGWGEQLLAAGINFDLAPVTDTVEDNRGSNAPIGALKRDYGLDAAGNGEHAAAFVAGMKAAGVGTSLKHFPGLGRVTGNTDYTTDGIVDTATTADDAAVTAFRTALQASPTAVMMAVATYQQLDPDQPAAFSKAVVTDLLRGQLGWDGLVLSDSLTAQAVVHVPAKDRAVKFIQAGGDIALFGSVADAQAALDGLVAAVAADADLAAQADAAALRVLRAKVELGLLD